MLPQATVWTFISFSQSSKPCRGVLSPFAPAGRSGLVQQFCNIDAHACTRRLPVSLNGVDKRGILE